MGTAETEFERFGPWVDPVRLPEDIPPLFRSVGVDLAAARVALKVPPDIPRRQASPEMNLYDHLVVLTPTEFIVFTRTGRGPLVPPDQEWVTTTHAALADVVAVRDSVSLLRARLSILLRDGREVAVAYNGAGAKGIGTLVRELRAALVPEGGSGGIERGPDDPETRAFTLPGRDIALVNAYREIARSLPDLRPWAWSAGARVNPRARGIRGVVTRVAHRWLPMTVAAMVVAGDDGALEVVSREDSLTRSRRPVTSIARLIVPLGALSAIEVSPDPDYDGVERVTLVAGQAAIALAVPARSATAALLSSAASAIGGEPTG